MTRVAVTGGAGFIGSTLVDSLVEAGREVVVLDDFSTGRHEFLSPEALSIDADLVTADPDSLASALKNVDTVFHLAANADVRFGWRDPYRDLRQNVDATLRICNAARSAGVADFVFASTGSVYPENAPVPTQEGRVNLNQTSLYGASKAAAESFISAFATAGHFRATVFRFVSVLGPRYTHGHVIDFVRQLVTSPRSLTILGDGTQRKSYMHVRDCVNGLLSIRSSSSDFEVVNLGHESYCELRQSAQWIVERMGLTPEFEFTGGDRGWIGDNPFIWLDVRRAEEMGWRALISIREAVEDTVDWLLANQWVLKLPDARGR